MTALHAASRGARLVAFASALAACASTVSEPTAGGGGSATSTGSGGATTSSQGGAGGATTSSQGGAGGGGGATTTAQGGAGGAGGTTAAGGAGGAGGVVPPPDCGALTDALVPIVAGPGACTAVVRLAYTTKKPLGFELVCGKYAKVDDASARATAQADTGWGADAKTISPPFPGDPDVFVFFEEPLDFGGLAAVSADTGQSVFGGGVVWSGSGDVTWPKTWRPAADLGVGCTPPPGIVPPPVRGFDFSSGGAQPLAPADAQAAFAVAFDSAITGAYAKTLYLRDSMVLLYPRTVGLFDPTNAEWVVLYNAYWLE